MRHGDAGHHWHGGPISRSNAFKVWLDYKVNSRRKGPPPTNSSPGHEWCLCLTRARDQSLEFAGASASFRSGSDFVGRADSHSTCRLPTGFFFKPLKIKCAIHRKPDRRKKEQTQKKKNETEQPLSR